MAGLLPDAPIRQATYRGHDIRNIADVRSDARRMAPTYAAEFQAHRLPRGLPGRGDIVWH
jgi:hypothetical protein